MRCFFTPSEREWLYENYSHYTNKEIIEIFAKRDRVVNERQLINFGYNNYVKKSKKVLHQEWDKQVERMNAARLAKRLSK